MRIILVQLYELIDVSMSLFRYNFDTILIQLLHDNLKKEFLLIDISYLLLMIN